MSRLQVVEERQLIDAPEAEKPKPEAASTGPQVTMQAATAMLITALRALSERFVIALSNLFTLLTAASAFYLWAIALPEITALKIVALSIYSVFVLALNIFGRRK